MISTSLAIKVCAHCGRHIEPRRMSDWNWERLRYCSAACRRRAGARVHRDIEAAIVALLAERGPGASICPSEAARRLFPDRFSNYMEDVRRGARRLAARGEVVDHPERQARGPDEFPRTDSDRPGATFSLKAVGYPIDIVAVGVHIVSDRNVLRFSSLSALDGSRHRRLPCSKPIADAKVEITKTGMIRNIREVFGESRARGRIHGQETLCR